MNKIILCFLYISLIFNASAADGSPETLSPFKLNYEIEYEAQKNRYFININFKGNVKGKIFLLLPRSWGGATTAHFGVKQLTSLSANTTIETTDNELIYVLKHAPEQDIHLRYQLVKLKNSSLSPIVVGTMLPIFDRKFIHWSGITSLILPFNSMSDKDEKFNIVVRGKGFPEKQPLRSSLPAKGDYFEFNGFAEDFLSSLFVAGDYRFHQQSTQYGNISLVIRGQWPFPDNLIFDRLVTTYKQQREFWQQSFTDDDLWVSLTPLEKHQDENVVVSRGAGLYKSFQTFLTPNMKADSINFLFMHEGFHHWLPGQFGEQKQHGQKMSWFGEGFSNYYTYKLQLESGQISQQQFDNFFIEAKVGIKTSPLLKWTNNELAQKFFTEPGSVDLIYWRGLVLAEEWDKEILQVNDNKQSLKDMLISLLNQQGLLKEDAKYLSPELLITHAEKFGVKNAKKIFDTIIK